MELLRSLDSPKDDAGEARSASTDGLGPAPLDAPEVRVASTDSDFADGAFGASFASAGGVGSSGLLILTACVGSVILTGCASVAPSLAVGASGAVILIGKLGPGRWNANVNSAAALFNGLNSFAARLSFGAVGLGSSAFVSFVSFCVVGFESFAAAIGFALLASLPGAGFDVGDGLVGAGGDDLDLLEAGLGVAFGPFTAAPGTFAPAPGRFSILTGSGGGDGVHPVRSSACSSA